MLISGLHISIPNFFYGKYIIVKYKFSEIVDITLLQNLMEGLYSASGILSAVTDIDGNILARVGWRDICAKFHRANIETELLCRQSDQYLAEHTDSSKHY